jgi:hypothetical protein
LLRERLFCCGVTAGFGAMGIFIVGRIASNSKVLIPAVKVDAKWLVIDTIGRRYRKAARVSL